MCFIWLLLELKGFIVRKISDIKQKKKREKHKKVMGYVYIYIYKKKDFEILPKARLHTRVFIG